ncbi:MAG: SCO family protein, partial [Burkholderiales bacterium]
MVERKRIAILVLPAVLAACDASTPPASKFHATDITGVDWARGFELTDPTGQRRTLADFRGKVVLVFFGFTNCPDACPTAMAEMAQVVDRLGPDGARVQALFITVDPERDTADVLAKYVPAFHPSFIGLRGSPEDIARTAKEFKVYY